MNSIILITLATLVTSNFDNNTFSVFVDLNGNNVSGMQSDFIYDARAISVNNISEGSFMSQNGNFSTFFWKGNILPTTLVNTFSVIIGHHTTGMSGVFMNLNTSGHGCIQLDNVKIADSDGYPIPFEIIPSCDTKFGTISGSVQK